MVQLLPILIKALETTTNFAGKVMDKIDDERYAKAVIELYGQEPTYSELDAQIEIIKNATDIPTEKKLALLSAVSAQRDAIREREIAKKKELAEVVDEGARKKGELAGKIALGVLSGGISLLPDAVNAITDNLLTKGKTDSIDEESND